MIKVDCADRVLARICEKLKMPIEVNIGCTSSQSLAFDINYRGFRIDSKPPSRTMNGAQAHRKLC